MHKFDVIALANTCAAIDIVLHPLFRLWIFIAPETYEKAMRLFVAGIQIHVEPQVDLNLFNFVIGTLLEAAVFWLLGALVGFVYNRFSK